MRQALAIVKGAVSTKDLVPVLTHVAIHAGRVCGYNGRIYISAPCKDLEGLSLAAPAEQFIAAIDHCGDETPKVTVEEGAVLIRAGRYRVTLPTLPIEEYPDIEPPPKKASPWKGELLPTLKRLHPFIGEDASRQWCCGVYFIDGKALATNNTIIAQTSFPVLIAPGFILPVQAVDELLRLNLEPIGWVITEDSVTFRLPGGVWLRTSLVSGQWPEGAIGLVGQLHQGARLLALPAGLAPAIERVRPFVSDPKAPVVLLGEEVRTQQGVQGAQVSGFKGLQGAFRVEPLQTVLEVATHADWSRFPRVPWKGAGIEGAIVGLTL